jgi:hypothetical protein
VARQYAGILGSLGMAIAMLRNLRLGSGFETSVTQAVASVTLLAAVGFLVGWIAEATVDEAVRTKLEQQLAEDSAAN